MQRPLVREAGPLDLPEIMALCRRFFEASGYRSFGFDEESMLGTLRRLMDHPDGVVLVADGGMVAGVVYPVFFNQSHRQAQELFWWVDDEARGSGVGRDLIRAFEKWAKSNDCKTVSMLCLEALEADKVEKLYLRSGYKPTERAFVKEL
jgi:GNAT superfamily N-acetyltransferase